MQAINPILTQAFTKPLAQETKSQPLVSTKNQVAFKDIVTTPQNIKSQAATSVLSPAKQLEAIVVGQMISQIMPKDSSYFGDGFAGEMWQSMMSEHMANTIVKKADFGLASLISKDVPST